MRRNFSHINKYLDALSKDIYAQPSDAGHLDWAMDLKRLIPFKHIETVLDVGCGDGVIGKNLFAGRSIAGITLNEIDFDNHVYWPVYLCDMSFLDFKDESFDLIFARHTLEHSPMPLLTLMEWYRVSSKYLLLVLPTPEYWGYGGKNHYYVLDKQNWETLLSRAEWKVLEYEEFLTTDPAFLRHYKPDEEDRERIHWEGKPKIVEYRWLLEK